MGTYKARYHAEQHLAIHNIWIHMGYNGMALNSCKKKNMINTEVCLCLTDSETLPIIDFSM